MPIPIFLILLLYFTVPSIVSTQPDAWREDTQKIENTVSTLMQLVSVDKGDTLDWPRLNNLFLPTARFNYFTFNKAGELVLVNHSLAEFKQNAGYDKVKFREIELFKRINQFGTVAQVFQGYRFTVNNDELVRAGVNCIQFI
jgi:hypothetical protein